MISALICSFNFSFASELIHSSGKTKSVKSCNVYVPLGEDYNELKEKGYNTISTNGIKPIYHEGFLEHKITTKLDYSLMNSQTGDLYIELGGLVYVNLLGWFQPKTQVKLFEVGEHSPVLIAVSKKNSSTALPWHHVFNLSDLPDCKQIWSVPR